MANNNENKILNVPNLRFPEFTGEWKQSLLKEYLVENKERNTKGVFSKAEVLSVSGDKGIVNQIELLGRSYAGQSVLPYHIVRRNNIVYTKSPLSEFPYGIVKMNRGNDGIVSTLYAVYSVQETAYPSFIEYYFASKDRTNRYFKPIVRIGAKHDMKIGNGEVLANMVRFPSIKEQRRISEFLELIDKRIATQNKIIDKLQSLISGLNDFLHLQVGGLSTSFEELGTSYSGLLGKSGDDFGKGKPYITYLNIYSNSIVNEEQVDYVIIGDNEKQNTLLYGDLLFTLSSETPDEVGIGAVYLGESDKYYLNSFCFGLHMTATNKVYSPYLAYLVSNSIFRKFIYPLAQGSTRFNLQKNDFMKKKFLLPTFENQKEIARTLNALSSKLETDRKLLLNYQEQKQYLLGAMFI